MANTKVTSRVLANDAVLTANIADDQVTTAKIADDVALGGNPTTTTQSAGNNTTRIATTAFVTTAVANLADSAPDALNTLNELAAALGDDANFSTTVTNSIAAKLPLAGGTMTGNLTLNGADIVKSGSADLTIDSGGRIDLSADDNGEIRLFDGSSLYAQFKDDSDRLKIQSLIQDKDMLFVGNDNGSEVTALTLDMSDAGAALFNSDVTITTAGKRYYVPRASDGAATGSLYSPTGNEIRLSGAGSSSGVLSFEPSSGSGVAVHIDNAGKVGIGNTAPTAKLDLGTQGVTRNSTYDVSTTCYISTSGGAATNTAASIPLTLGRDDNASTGDEIGLTYDFDDGGFSSTAGVFARMEDASTAYTALDLRTWGGGFSTGLTVNSVGKIGIGTTSPSHRLTAKSDANTNPAIKVEQTGSTDGWGFIPDNTNGNLEFSRIGGGTEGSHLTLTNTGYAAFAGADDVRLTLGSTGTAGNNNANWIRGESAFLAFNSASSGFKYEIGGSEKIRITSGGGVNIGTTSGANNGGVIAEVADNDTSFYARGSNGRVNFKIHTEATGGRTWYLRTGGTAHFGSGGGDFLVLNEAGTAIMTWDYSASTINGDFNDTSDVGLKENIVDITDGITKIKALKPRTFDWKEKTKLQGTHGFIAQEVETVLPNDVVGENYDADNPEHGSKSLNTSGLLAVAVKAIQEQQEQIESLKKEVEELKGG